MSTATEIKLLTLLNVSAVKRPRELDVPGGHRGSPSASPSVSGAKAKEPDERTTKRRKSVVFGGEVGPSGSTYNKKGKLDKGKGKSRQEVMDNGVVINWVGGEEKEGAGEAADEEEGNSEDEEEGESSGSASDMFNVHFGPEPPVLTSEAVESANEKRWKTQRKLLKGFGSVVEQSVGSSSASPADEIKTRMTPSISASLKSVKEDAPNPLFPTALSQLGSYKDFYFHSLDGEADGSESAPYGEQKEAMRQAAVAHALNHVLKTRRKIIKNNEKLAHAAANGPNGSIPDPPRDQSFTRPKVLLLLPLRSLALHYLKTLLLPLAPAGTQIENQKPFLSSFSTPADETDPLSAPDVTLNYPLDHLVNFKGNSDDNFRFGIKITRKAWRIVMMPANESKLLDCDFLIASPLGFKMAAEREDSTDLLSSIEICVVDGVDVMQMQNWEHVQFIFNNINKIPKSPHGCDFSRVKPWYLESQAQYLRQTILLSRYDTPEARALFNKHCLNLQGKVRSDKTDFAGVLGRVRSGVRQNFERINVEEPSSNGHAQGQGKVKGGDAAEEVEIRLEHFTKKTIPALLRSAVSRQNTLIVVPSYFDFVRLTNYLRKADVVSYAAISEYSSNSEISRARTLFFKSKKSFLVVTERFHFYRRYLLRGAKTIVFYSLPDHAQFYAEFLCTPFVGSGSASGSKTTSGSEVDEAEVSSRVLYSRFDKLKLERVVGSANARRLLGGDAKFEFV